MPYFRGMAPARERGKRRSGLNGSAQSARPESESDAHRHRQVHPVICSSVPCDNIEGFATVSVAPDGSSITITIQVPPLPWQYPENRPPRLSIHAWPRTRVSMCS